jgi:biopolymer transport protein ExbB
MDYATATIDLIETVFTKGGPLVWVLLGLLIWGVYIIARKSVELRRDRIISPQMVQRVEELLLDNRLPDATAYCKQNAGPMTRIILAGIYHFDRSEAELKDILEEAGRQEVPGIRRHLTVLGTIAGVAPLVGLLGTVLGMIEVFATLSQGTGIEATDLAGGISEALITTACGLVVAMPTIAFYNGFNNRASNLIIEMEKVSLHLVAVLKRSR